ncbi:MAG TPA: hypothetical protein VHT25_09400 [Solirubrobacteraceae bacterium]|jgi:hypothetical protein|nr:hypothetical protein [Solirubrobacteraceae bacterium]
MTIAVSRRALAYLALLGLAMLVPSTALANPVITAFKVSAVPLPGFPGTGNMRGAGAAIEGEAKISGTEYGGFPSPLIGIKFHAPAGAKLHPQGFGTCAPSTIEASGPGPCPRSSIAGPKGRAVGAVSFGEARVPETASVQAIFVPGGKLVAFIDGTTPVLLEILASAHVISSSPPFGFEFLGEVPLIETVPGALDASFVEGAIKVGAAYKRGKKTIYYITMPRTCPKGGWPVKLELSFLGGATAEASSKMPCPTR